MIVELHLCFQIWGWRVVNKVSALGAYTEGV